ncbi:MAG: hypothetical protein KUG56_06380 [Kordiimonadaceae bacterium]|nr:hypothetical protein [Kordiimonadaceae bacterium]
MSYHVQVWLRNKVKASAVYVASLVGASTPLNTVLPEETLLNQKLHLVADLYNANMKATIARLHKEYRSILGAPMGHNHSKVCVGGINYLTLLWVLIKRSVIPVFCASRSAS